MVAFLQSICDAGDQQQGMQVLASTVRSALALAAAEGMQSIAMPLIGNGRAGWPAKAVAKVHVEQVLEFFNSATASTALKVLVCV